MPLAVRVVTTLTDRHITNQIRDLTFREVAAGGYASARFTLDRPLTMQPGEVAYYGRVYIHDGRNGAVVWEGRLEDPGAGSDGSGQVWDLTAMGPSAHAQDRSVPLIYVDTRTSGVWEIGPASASAQYVDINFRGEDDAPAIQMKINNGSTFGAGHAGMVGYNHIYYAGQELGRVSVSWSSGFTSSNNEARLGSGLGSGVTVNIETDTMSVASGTLVGSRGGANDITAGHDEVRLRLARITSNLAVVSELVYIEFADIAVRSLLKNASGSDITSGYTADTVLASEVVADLLGRLLTEYDGANAVVETTTHDIDQLAYTDAVTPAKVLEDLMAIEPGFRWGAYESNSAGLHRFEWKAWPSSVRYEAEMFDGIDLPGSASGLFNAVRVRYVDARGHRKTVKRTATVAELDAAGLERVADVDLGDEVGSTANATQVGDQFLAEHATAPSGGRLTVARPVLDLLSGRMVQPWEIRAGELIRVRGLLPRSEALTATGRDGVNVFRIASREFTVSNASAVLELDQYSLSTARALAEMATAKPTKKRRR